MESIVRNFATDLLRHRRYNYSQEPLEEFLLVNSDIDYHNFRILNQKGYLLDTLILKREENTTCILYAHGLGSNKLEALWIAKYFLRQRCDVCSFDFSGSGRSEGDSTTYGINERDDLLAVLKHLQSMNKYSRVVLWGRSMGAVAVVLAQQRHQSPKIDCMILDSPFSSFQKIAIEIASKKSLIPQFMIELVIEPLKQYFKNHQEVNPFTIELEDSFKKINANILLIYSCDDSVVSSQHSKNIVKYCRRNPVEIVIKEDHNMQRSKSTLHQTLSFIRDSGRQAERKVLISRQKNRGISVASRQQKDRESVRSSSKLKLTNTNASKLSGRQPSTKPERHIRTVASFNQSMTFSKRLETENEGPRKKTGTISSIFMQNKVLQKRLSNANKENKPSLNLLRKNRFR